MLGKLTRSETSTTGSIPCAMLASLLLIGVAVSARGQGADPRRFLPDPGAPGVVFEYGDGGYNYDQPVRDTTKDIDAGMIRFDWSRYTRMPTGTVSGGAALAGGFYMSPGVQVKPGFRIAWVQTITATRTGTDAQTNWNLPAMGAGQYPDSGPDSPIYPFQFVPIIPPGLGAPLLGFQDFPDRNFADGNQSWEAELGLTCISNTANLPGGFQEVRVIDTLMWYFEFRNLPVPAGQQPGIGNVHGGIGPWQNPSVAYLSALNDFYDGMGGGPPAVASSLYQFSNNDNCFIPEPATLALLGLCALLARRRKRLRGQGMRPGLPHP